MGANIPAWKLQRSLVDVCNPKASKLPMLCQHAVYGALLRQRTAGDSIPVDTATKQMLLTALCAAKDKAPGDSKHPAFTPKIGTLIGSDTVSNFAKIAEFNAKTNQEQRAFVDEIWKRLVDFRIPSTIGTAMFEHDGPLMPAATPLPSSIAPSNPQSPDLISVRRDALGSSSASVSASKAARATGGTTWLA